ncbi:GumC family protein [Silvibacterium sp.]|uniref:GumC family protein n=1 Tax=Silvibacterium sp. TaxID=1964179 RepID=UPI0039E2642D
MQGWSAAPQEPQKIESSPAFGAVQEQAVFTPADLRKLVFKRKWIILACVIAGLGIGLFFALATTPQYEASARVHVDLSRSANIGIDDLIQQQFGGMNTPDKLQTQVQIMQSETVAMEVINALDLYHKAPFNRVFRKWPYTGTLTPIQRTAMLTAFSSSTKIQVLPNTEMVQISFRNPDPEVAMEGANAIVDSYLDRDLRAKFQGTTRVSNWLSQQLTSVKKQVEDSQKQLAKFQRENNLVAMGTNGDDLTTERLRSVSEQLSEAEADRIVKEARYRMALTRNPDLLVSVAPQTVLGGLRSQQAALLVQAAQLKAKFGPNYPKVLEVNDQLTKVQNDIDQEINSLTKRFTEEYEASVNTESLMRARLDAAKQDAYRENESAAQFDILKHGAESASELYDALQLRLKEAGITAGLSATNIDVIDRASVPPYPVLPAKRSDVMFGFIGGLIVGLALAFFIDGMDDTIRTSEDAEQVSHLPTLAVIPRFVTAARKSGSREAAEQLGGKVGPDLLSYLEPQSLAAEAYRTLRSAILLSAVDTDMKLLLVTSSFAAEGKSTCSANLAISFAQRSARVLIVDTDLRKGTLHMKFRMSNRAGLSTVLSRESGSEAYENPIPELPNLTVLGRGPIAPNPGEILASRAMSDLLMKWRNEYDHIILDSSPILAVSDTLGLAQQSDATFVLVRAGVTRKKALQRIREQLRRANARILGTIVNGVDLRLENYHTYSKGYGYGYKSNYGAGYGVSEDHDAQK